MPNSWYYHTLVFLGGLLFRRLLFCGLSFFVSFLVVPLSKAYFGATSKTDIVKAVKSDFLNYHPFVNNNGLIVLDDYCNIYPGILKFVDEFIKNNKNFQILGVFDNNELIIKKLN